MTTMRPYPAVTIERDRAGNLKMWRGGSVAEGQKCNVAFPREDLYIQVDHGKEYILADLGAGERNNYELGYRITTHNIDPAYFGEYADRPEWFQKPIDESETPLEQEQTSGTDVLPSDCKGCPLHQAKQHKSDTVSVELTRAELDWLRVAAVCSPWSGAEDLALGNQVYEKLKRSSK